MGPLETPYYFERFCVKQCLSQQELLRGGAQPPANADMPGLANLMLEAGINWTWFPCSHRLPARSRGVRLGTAIIDLIALQPPL